MGHRYQSRDGAMSQKLVAALVAAGPRTAYSSQMAGILRTSAALSEGSMPCIDHLSRTAGSGAVSDSHSVASIRQLAGASGSTPRPVRSR
jgi:hypothetical protein